MSARTGRHSNPLSPKASIASLVDILDRSKSRFTGLAADERRRIARDSTYRSSRERLERLCRDGMVASVGRQSEAATHAFDVQRLGRRALAEAARKPKGSVVAAAARSLGMQRWRV